MGIGAPRWMGIMAAVSFVYAIANFLLIMPSANGKSTNQDLFAVGGTGHAMAFYAAALWINWAAVKRRELGIVWECENGHKLAPADKFCSQCGAKTKSSAGGVGGG